MSESSGIETAPPIEPESLLPRVRLSRDPSLLFLMGMVGLLLAPAFALPFEFLTEGSLGTELINLWTDHYPLELFFPVPSIVFAVLTLHLFLFSDRPRISVVTASLILVCSVLAGAHEVITWDRELGKSLDHVMGRFSLYRANLTVLFLAVGAGLRNLKQPSSESAFAANGALVAWLFTVAFPGVGVVYPLGDW